MAIQTQLRRGTTAENNAFTGALGEITVDTDLDELRVHDAARAGGFNVPNFSSIQKRLYNYGAAGGTATAVTVSTQVNALALTAGLRVYVKMGSAAVDGGTTLQWGSLTATAVKKWVNGAKTDIEDDDWENGQIIAFDYDGTHWVAALGGNGGGGLVATGSWTAGSPSPVSFGAGTFVAGKDYTVFITKTDNGSSPAIQLREAGVGYLTGAYYDTAYREVDSAGNASTSHANNQSSIQTPATTMCILEFNDPAGGWDYAQIGFRGWAHYTSVNNRTRYIDGASCYLESGARVVDGFQIIPGSGSGICNVYEG